MERDGEMEVEGYKEGGATVVSTPYQQRNENMRQLTNTQVPSTQVPQVPSAHVTSAKCIHVHKCTQVPIVSTLYEQRNENMRQLITNPQVPGDYLETKFGFWNW